MHTKIHFLQSSGTENMTQQYYLKKKNNISERVSDCCLMPSVQFFSYIMARLSDISML